MIPTTTVALDERGAAKSVLRLMDALEDHDDVEAVYANFDIPDAVERRRTLDGPLRATYRGVAAPNPAIG
jgi:hypothetical protein